MSVDTVNWDNVKVDYENGMSLKDLAQKYGVKANTVKGRRQRGGWKRNVSDDTESNIDISEDSYTIDDYMYAEGYSPKEIRDIVYPYSYLEDEEIVKSRAEGCAYKFLRKSDAKEGTEEWQDIFDSYAESAERNSIIFNKVEVLEELLDAERIALGLGVKRKVSIKYDGLGKTISTTVVNIQPTKEEVSEAYAKVRKSSRSMAYLNGVWEKFKDTTQETNT